MGDDKTKRVYKCNPTHKETTRILRPSEQVTPVHEYRLGKHGSPFQSAGGFWKLLLKFIIAITAIKEEIMTMLKYNPN